MGNETKWCQTMKSSTNTRPTAFEQFPNYFHIFQNTQQLKRLSAVHKKKLNLFQEYSL